MKFKKYVILIAVGIFCCVFDFNIWLKSIIERYSFAETIYYDMKVEKSIREIKKAKDLETKYKIASSLLYLAQIKGEVISYLSLDEAEKVFIEVANKYDVELSKEVKKDSVLHVTSYVYSSGGHTRVIERWIENSPDNETHSFVITNKEGMTDRLKRNIEKKGGEIYTLDPRKNNIEKALELRKIASSYEKIVLHIFGDDYIPLIAFGTEKFKRPVFLFDLIDHRFEVGFSVADCVVNYRKYGEDMMKKYRGGKINRVIPLPIDFDKSRQYAKEEARKMLNLPLDKKIVFSSGTGCKFIPKDGYNFGEFMEKFYQKRKDVLFVLVGPDADMLGIKGKIPQENYLFFNRMPNSEFVKYLATADIVIDSMPLTGGVTVIDAIIAKKPVLSLKTKISQNDFIVESRAYKETMEELVESAVELYDDKEKAKDLWQEQFNALKERHGVEVWRKQIKELYDTFKTHSIHDFKSVKKEYEIW